jgi:chemotaxis protein methyltransferase CheR
MEILAPNLLNAQIAAPQLKLPLAYQGATLSLQNGNCPWSSLFYVVVGLQMCGAVDVVPSDESVGAVKTAYQLQKVALDLVENPNNARSKAKTLDAVGYIQPWNEPIKNALDTMLKAHEAGLETGSLAAAAYSIYVYAKLSLAAGMNLNEFQRKVSGYNQRVKGIGQELMYRRNSIDLQTAHNFMTPGSTPHVLKGQHFDEDQWFSDAVATNDRAFLNHLFLEKLWLSYHFDCDDRLIEYAGEAEKYLDGVTGGFNMAFFRLYDSLSRLRLYDGFSENERQETLKRVVSNQLRMRIWSETAPMNFKHKYDLVAAETARVTGKIGPAMENYEQAIKGAKDNEFIHEEALANELYARLWHKRGNDRIAEMYMREARVLYHQWGANAKVRHLEKRYPQWFKTKIIPRGQPDSPDSAGKVRTTITQPITSIQMDLDSIISASQTLSAETDLEQLLSRMMNLVMANSGAEKGVLLLRQENDWFVQARSDITDAEHEIMLNRPYDPADSDNEGVIVPERAFHYCRRSKEVLVVGDAQLDQRFAQDRMIQKQGIKSIACIPALNQGELKAMLYLENRQMSDVFTLERVEILQHLSSQFSVSVENTLLYDSLSRKVRELQQSEERYDLAVTGSAAGIWDWDIGSEKLYYSDRMKELLGYAPDELLDTLDEFWNRLHPDDYEAVRLALEQHLKQRVPYIIDCRLQTKSGEYRWFHARGQALWDKTGRATRMSGSVTDITERKQVEASREKLLHDIGERLKELSCIYTISNSIRTKQSLDEIFQDVVNAIPHGWHYPDIARGKLRYKEREWASEPFDETEWKQSSDITAGAKTIGSVEVYYLEERPTLDEGPFLKEERNLINNIARILGETIERRNSAENLLKSEERFRVTFEQAAVGIAHVSPDGHFLRLNQKFCDIVGYSYDEMRNLTFQKITHPDDLETDLVSVHRLLEGKDKAYSMEKRYICKDGEIVWVNLTVSILLDDIGKPHYFVSVVEDITKRKMAEIELRGAYTEIEQLKNQLEAESAYLQDEIKLEHNFENIIGQSKALKYVLHRVEQVAPLDFPVLIMGETGTGKELMARALHKLSPHGKRALVKVNCAALPGELIESELFGREKGAFTGATTTQLGRFELAKGSTLFLDEIGELPLELQAKLLRVLETGEFERLGSARTLHSDARIIAATNRVLEEEMRKGRFREDLWYRLKVFPITVPPLREHPEDIPLLVKWFVDQLVRKMGKRAAEIPKRTMQLLQRYPWPGNVRELQHAIESAMITAEGKKLNFELPKIEGTALNDFKSLEEMERDYILRVLKAKNWKITGEDGAASILGKPSSTLRSRMKKLGLKRPS